MEFSPRSCTGTNIADRGCHIVIGNHPSHLGIGEILYTLHHHFSQAHTTTVSQFISPDRINVIIDEFTNPYLVKYISDYKRRHPRTRIVIVATEFVTSISFLGFVIGKTFDYFNIFEDWHHIFPVLAHRLALANPPYLHRRYIGFVAALRVSDLILSIHPSILITLRLLAQEMKDLASVPLTIYPEIDPDQVVKDDRLSQLPPGFTMTGTLTKFRVRTAKKLIRVMRLVGISGSIYRYMPFAESPGFHLTESGIAFEFDTVTRENGKAAHDSIITTKLAMEEKNEKPDYLFNFNPPQRANWGYSSPMRILRAVLFGQIPVVTQKFGDHEIESIAQLWDGKVATAQKLFTEAAVGREELIERYIASIAQYNQIARKKNEAVDRAFNLL
jgi:hypothetical protein